MGNTYQDVYIAGSKTFATFNSLIRGRCGNNFEIIIFKPIIKNSLGIRCVIALVWVLWNHSNDKSTLGQVMAWCLGQSRCIWMSHNGVTMLQWLCLHPFFDTSMALRNTFTEKYVHKNLYNGPLPNDSETPVVCNCSVMHASFTCWHTYILPQGQISNRQFSVRI